MWTDWINGALEVVAGAFIWLSIRKIKEDQQARGISWVQLVFFGIWGFWNLPFYYALEQWISFCGAVAVAIMNCWYFALVVRYYRRDELPPVLRRFNRENPLV